MAKVCNDNLIIKITATFRDGPEEVIICYHDGISNAISALDTTFYFNDGKITHIDKIRQIKDTLYREDACTLILTKEYSIYYQGRPVDRLKIEKFVKKAPKVSWPTAYASHDVNATREIYRTFQVTPEKVIFNDPATIVIWKDGTKTVVKCMEGDIYNPEVGLAMCVCKKVFDKKYHMFFKYYVPKELADKEDEKKEEASLDEIYDKIAEMAKDALKTDKSFLEKFASQLFGKEENIK